MNDNFIDKQYYCIQKLIKYKYSSLIACEQSKVYVQFFSMKLLKYFRKCTIVSSSKG